MYSAHRSILAVALILVSNFAGTAAFPQGLKFMGHTADPPPPGNSSARPAACMTDLEKAGAVRFAGAPTARDAGSSCADLPPVSAPSVNPCNPSSPAQTGCNPPRDLVQEDLVSGGKRGKKILRARERVLEILQSENACSAWFREKDANPAATFRTLRFEVDLKGVDFVLESREPDSMRIFHDPYIASVVQDSGAYATVSLNPNGAFFRAEARLIEIRKDGGAFTPRGSRFMNVGLYEGGTLSAQTLALLHEFGHVLNLLPMDLHDVGGKSVQNTQEVLRYCRSAIESKPGRNALAASR